jgi:hypothetical protein
MTSGSERSPASPTRIVSRCVVRHNDPAGNQVNLAWFCNTTISRREGSILA